MKITLNIDGKEKVFETVKLKGIAYLKVINAIKKLDKINKKKNGFEKKEFYLLAGVVSECFNKQFTKEQFINSVNLEDILPVYTGLLEECESQFLYKSNI